MQCCFRLIQVPKDLVNLPYPPKPPQVQQHAFRLPRTCCTAHKKRGGAVCFIKIKLHAFALHT